MFFRPSLHTFCCRCHEQKKKIVWPQKVGPNHVTPPPPCNSYALVQATAGLGTVLIVVSVCPLEPAWL